MFGPSLTLKRCACTGSELIHREHTSSNVRDTKLGASCGTVDNFFLDQGLIFGPRYQMRRYTFTLHCSFVNFWDGAMGKFFDDDVARMIFSIDRGHYRPKWLLKWSKVLSKKALSMERITAKTTRVSFPLEGDIIP